jgi:hypothetical protein
MGWVGLEPTTNALKGRCSTIELPTLGKRSGTVSLKSSVASPFRIAAKRHKERKKNKKVEPERATRRAATKSSIDRSSRVYPITTFATRCNNFLKKRWAGDTPAQRGYVTVMKLR